MSATTSHPPRITTGKKLLFTTLNLFLLLAALEVGFRIAWNRPPTGLGQGLGEAGLVISDDRTGWRGAPNRSVSFKFPLGDHAVRVTTNSRGFRDTEHALTPTPDRPRVVVVGDSFVFGYGVGDGEVLTDHLRRLLPEAEVVNLGVSGFNLAQQHRLLELDGLAYHPVIVVLAFCQNDITRAVIPQRAGATQARPPTWKERAASASVLCAYIRASINGSPRLSDLFISLGLKEPRAAFEELSDNLRPALKQYPPEMESMWTATLAELVSTRGTCARAHAQMLLAPIPAREAIDPSMLEHSLSSVTYTATEFDLARPYQELAAFAQREGITYADALPAFRASTEPLYLPHFEIHLTSHGHRVYAEAVAPRVRALLTSIQVSVEGRTAVPAVPGH